MNHFRNAKVVRLQSHHKKYLTAEDDDEDSVRQCRDGSAQGARWTVELIGDAPHLVRLKSCYGRYLTASGKPFLLGMTGKKVLQTKADRLDSSVEWEPITDGLRVKLKARSGSFLRANFAYRPWRNSITHDIPHRTMTQEWVFWHVDVVEMTAESRESPPIIATATSSPAASPKVSGGSPASSAVTSQSLTHGATSISFSPPPSESASPSHEEDGHSSSASSSPAPSPPHHPLRNIRLTRSSVHELSRGQSWSGSPESPATPLGRTIWYYVARDDGEVDESYKGRSFFFEGSSVEELSRRAEEETGIRDVILCTVLNEKLYRLRVNRLPPNSKAMTIVVVPSSSLVAKSLGV